MARMRTIREALKHVKALDPNTSYSIESRGLRWFHKPA